MRVHVVQLCSTNDKSKNLKLLLEHLNSLSLQPNDLICLPENSLFMRATREDPVDFFKIDDPEIFALSNWCKQKNVSLHLGAIPLQTNTKVYNSSLRILADGSIVNDYQKIHLFDVDVTGQKSIRESDTFTAGVKASIFTHNDWKVGQTICYDLRFSALYMKYAEAHVDAILVPSSFLYVTGKAHWEILLRARAIETQAYIIAPAQGGVHMGLHRTWGRSMVVDPWGEIVAEITTESQVPQSILVEIDKGKILSTRSQIPLHNHRKPIV
jgi:predicted amidohydrolase